MFHLSIKVDEATQHLQKNMHVVGPTLSKLRNAFVAQDVNELPLIGPPLLLSCFIQGLDGTRGQILDCSDTKHFKCEKQKENQKVDNRMDESAALNVPSHLL